MSGDFIDSNVLIYLFDKKNVRKRAFAGELIDRGLGGSAIISFQVVQETLNVITTKLVPSATSEEAAEFLSEVLVRLWRVMPSERLYVRALDLQRRYQYSFYDSLIIAAALEADCARLYSEDVHDGQQIEGLKIIDPFK